MKIAKLKFGLLGLLLPTLVLFSCNEDEEPNPISSGASVTVTNTFQSDAFTDGAELAIEDLFMLDAGALAATATVGSGVEFSAYLLNLYDIDISENSIRFEVVAQEGDPTYGDLFRILEAGTVDRYYLTFDENQNVSSASSTNAAVNLRLDSDKVLVVEIGEGYDFKPGQNFTLTLN